MNKVNYDNEELKQENKTLKKRVEELETKSCDSCIEYIKKMKSLEFECSDLKIDR